MSATGYTPISLYYSSTASNVPSASNLANGELAINITDGKLFYKDNTGTVQTIASKTSVQNSISFGTTGLTPNTATQGAVTVSGTLAVANGGTGVTPSTGTGSVVLSASPTFTGTPAAPTAASSTNTTQLATTAFVQTAVTTAIQILFPVGSIYTATVSTNPATLLGFGTWAAFGQGQVLIGAGTGGGGTYTGGSTGGSKDAIIVSHTHTATFAGTALPTHSHLMGGGFGGGGGIGGGDLNNSITNTATQAVSAGTPAGTVAVDTTGASGTNANLPPYIVVYMWQRTA